MPSFSLAEGARPESVVYLLKRKGWRVFAEVKAGGVFNPGLCELFCSGLLSRQRFNQKQGLSSSWLSQYPPALPPQLPP